MYHLYLVPISFGQAYVLSDLNVSSHFFAKSKRILTRTSAKRLIPPGCVLNDNFASSPKIPNGEVSFVGSFENMASLSDSRMSNGHEQFYTILPLADYGGGLLVP